MTDRKELFKMVDDVAVASEKMKSDHNAALDEVAKALNSIELGDDVTKPFLAVLGLPDEEFQLIAPFLLVEFNKDFHDSNNQLMMVQTFNANGTRLEDLYSEIQATIDAMDSEEIELSQPKRDFIKQIFMDLYNAISEIKGIPKRIINVPIEVISAQAKIPQYANPTDSGMDVYAMADVTIAPGETKLIPTGLKVAIPVGYELQVRPKSGRSLKTKLRIANTPGTIDAGYRDEIGIIVENVDAPIKKIYMNDNGTIAAIDYGSSYTIGQGEKFAQLVLCEVSHCAFNQIDSVSDVNNDGRTGGFGSTGLK